MVVIKTPPIFYFYSGIGKSASSASDHTWVFMRWPFKIRPNHHHHASSSLLFVIRIHHVINDDDLENFHDNANGNDCTAHTVS